MSGTIDDCTIELLDSDNVGVAIEIVFLSAIDPEITWGVLPPPPITT